MQDRKRQDIKDKGNNVSPPSETILNQNLASLCHLELPFLGLKAGIWARMGFAIPSLEFPNGTP